MKTYPMIRPRINSLRNLVLMTMFGWASVPAQAQTITHVGGDSIIGDTVLTTVTEGFNRVATVPRGGVHWTAAGGEGVVYSHLTSPVLTVPAAGAVTLRFTHRYNFETGWDGGAVYVTVNGVGPTYVGAEAFSTNSYIGDTSAAGSHTWTGGEKVFYNKSTNWGAATLIESVATLGPFNAGDKISVEFRGGWDDGYNQATDPGFDPAAPGPAWEIGTVELRDSADTAMLNVDFINGGGGFSAVSDLGLTGPWLYAGPISQFEINGNTLAADRYVPDSPGADTLIDITGTDLKVVLLTGTLEAGDSFTLFNLAGGTTLRGSYNRISLPPGTWNLSNLGVTGTITYLGPPTTDAATSTVAASLPKLWADGFDASTITVTLKSHDGLPVAGKTVTLTSSRPSADTITGSPATSDANGVATLSVKSSTLGSSIYTATDTTGGVEISQKANITFVSDPTALASYIPADNAGKTVTVLRNYNFHGSTLDSWSAALPPGRNTILTDAGVQLGGARTDTYDHGAWVGMISHPVAGDPEIGGLSFIDSGVEIRFNAPNMTAPTDSLELLTLKSVNPEGGFGISAQFGTIKMYTRQKNGGSHVWSNPDKTQLIGPHTMTLLRLAGGTVKTYLDGVAVDTWEGTPDPTTPLNHIGLGMNEFDGNQYWPIGSVISRITAFTVGTAPTDYENWAATYPGFNLTNPNADADGDGLSNHEEYAFALNPTKKSSINPITVPLDTSAGTFSYTRRASPSVTGLRYTVWHSANLLDWHSTGATEGTVTTVGAVETVPVTLDAALLAGPKLFIRVTAE